MCRRVVGLSSYAARNVSMRLLSMVETSGAPSRPETGEDQDGHGEGGYKGFRLEVLLQPGGEVLGAVPPQDILGHHPVGWFVGPGDVAHGG